ncbi:diguanylate cyclase (GGDEF)-like protein [Geothermobacter ehrlichii]|uniref:Diguanylate cyclase (GGDEF)-like protein n=1 Tax=Geothermobacter ehrlichii TaxID=213224 RepID=A0A5D3WP67_9BACT|nr:response regulator [Geothermobacter ehrlichii]TYO99996.1 diguanylate cyclase (GGDEF)-like protein [Geothermobacter ehrlichii]
MARGRILTIDSEDFYRRFYHDVLTDEGYLVSGASSLDEGLDWLRREEFDLVIVDLGLAGGGAVAAAIRQFNPDQEIMVVTGREEVALAVEAMKQGVSDYLLKPINPEEFLLVVNRTMFRLSLGMEHKRLMNENIEFVSMLACYRKCLAFLRVHDLDRLGDLVLDTLMELLRAEGGLLWLVGYAGRSYRLRCRRGLVRLQPGEEVLEPDAALEKLLHGGLPVLQNRDKAILLPLQVERRTVALVRLEAPTGRESFNRHDLKVAELVAEFAAAALDNVLARRALEHDSLRLPASQAYKMAYFRDHVTRELYKARRYGRNLSFIKLDITNYRPLADRVRDRDMQEAVNRLVGIVNTALRDADIMAQAAPGSYIIMLPETDYWGSLVAQQRIRRALDGTVAVSDGRRSQALQVLMRSASFPVDGDSFDDLVAVAERRQERLRQSLYHRAGMERESFWAIVGRLLGTAADYRLEGRTLRVSERLRGFEDRRSSRYVRMPASRREELLTSFCRDLVESRRIRGIIYLGSEDFQRERDNLPLLEEIEHSATNLFLLGGRRRVGWDLQRVVPIHIDDEQFRRLTLLLYLNEDYAYALFARRFGEELVGFHTSDFYFVENMIAKLQQQYRLQPKI